MPVFIPSMEHDITFSRPKKKRERSKANREEPHRILTTSMHDFNSGHCPKKNPSRGSPGIALSRRILAGVERRTPEFFIPSLQRTFWPVAPFDFLVELGIVVIRSSGLDANLLGNRTVMLLR